MKKRGKKSTRVILIIVLAVFFAYMIFVFIDFSRLKNSKRGTRPLICIKEEVEEHSQEYWGLGYSVKYFVDSKDLMLFENKENMLAKKQPQA